MAEDTKKKDQVEDQHPEDEAAPAPEETDAPEQETDPLLAELEELKDRLSAKEDQYLRLAAEFDNFRKRSQKEKDAAYGNAKSDAVAAFLPVYDNLERALKQECADEAYKKGVEMTMNQLKEVLSRLGVTEIPALGQAFDPNLHNAVMHIEDDAFGENTVAEVFQAGFQCGDKVIRFAMVKVAN